MTNQTKTSVCKTVGERDTALWWIVMNHSLVLCKLLQGDKVAIRVRKEQTLEGEIYREWRRGVNFSSFYWTRDTPDMKNNTRHPAT